MTSLEDDTEAATIGADRNHSDLAVDDGLEDYPFDLDLDDGAIDDDLDEADRLQAKLDAKGYGRNVKKLELGKVTPYTEVFQPRLGINGKHVGTLQRALGDHSDGLEALTVLPIGEDYYLVDGYHRYEAYKAAQWSRKVPVRCVMVDVAAAVRLSMQGNSKDKLPLTTEEKMNCAWRLVVSGNGSKKEQREASGASDGTIGAMRKTAKILGEDAANYRHWWQAREARAKLEAGEGNISEEVWNDRAREKAEKWARGMAKGIPNHATEDMAALTMAIQLLVGHKIEALLSELDLEEYGYTLVTEDDIIDKGPSTYTVSTAPFPNEDF